MQPGDLVLTHRNAPASKLIGFGQRLKFRGDRRKYAHWTHCAIVVGFDGTIAEALSHGVCVTNLRKYENVEHVVVDTQATLEQRALVVAFALHEVGYEYGYLENVSEGLFLSFGSLIEFGKNGQTNCSSHCAGALSRTAAIFPKEPMFMLPADLAEYYKVD
jgi:hypothetical protein